MNGANGGNGHDDGANGAAARPLVNPGPVQFRTDPVKQLIEISQRRSSLMLQPDQVTITWGSLKLMYLQILTMELQASGDLAGVISREVSPAEGTSEPRRSLTS